MNILYWIYKSRLTTSGTAPIQMRITIDSRRISFGTGLYIEPTDWSHKKQSVSDSSPNAKEINAILITMKAKVLTHYNECLFSKVSVSVEGLKMAVFGQNNFEKVTYLEAFKYHIDNLKSRVGFDIAIN